ncbi:MAG: hypothetical protein RLZ98_1216 [Pseudomonadota bacterium]|jgi:membrane AbrB-like protein
MDQLRRYLTEVADCFHPERFSYPGFALALAIGGIGGWIFWLLQLPLPWMLGSMVFCTLAAVAGVRIESPVIIRRPTVSIISVMLGAAFTPQLLASLWTWFPTIIGLSVSTILSGIVCVAYFRYVAGFNAPTAYFSGMPGGVVEMVMLGEQYKADVHRIALVQASRILILVFALPFIVQMMLGISLGQRPPVGQSVLETPFSSYVLLIFCAVVGYHIGPKLNFPAPPFTGPLFVSGLLHVLGLTDFKPATEIVIVAQVILGGYIGTSFRGVSPAEFVRTLATGMGAAGLLLVTTITVAYITSLVSRYEMIPLLLAFSPGGVIEMSLIALALHIEVAFVACHHLMRVLIVIGGAAIGFEWLTGRKRQQN